MNLLRIIFIANLLALSLDHLISGGLALFAPKKAIIFYRALFGAVIPETKEYFLILKPWGALGIFAGLVGILPIIDPHRYSGVLILLEVLLILRLIYRLMFQNDAESFLQIAKKRNLTHVALILVCAVVIALQLYVEKL